MLRDILIKEGLSNREAEVANLVIQGLSNKDVANRLFVTEKTVKFHLTNIYKKMHVKSRAQLIVWCLPNMSFVENDSITGQRQGLNIGRNSAKKKEETDKEPQLSSRQPNDKVGSL